MDFRRLAPYAVPFNPGLLYEFLSESDVENNTNGFLAAQAFAPAHPLYKNFLRFAQGEWAVTQRLSLSFGLRWEVNPPPGVTQGQMPYTVLFQDLDPNNWALAPQGTLLWKTTWFNFAPRLGLAYTFRNTPGWETVVRTGGGLFFDSGQQLGSIAFEGPGFSSARVDFPSSFPGNPVPPPVNPPQTLGFIYGYYPHLQLPYTLQWNASIEQALGGSQAITASYVGAHGGRLLQENQFPSYLATSGILSQAFNGMLSIENGLTSDYDSAQLQYRRRLSRGLVALGSYTWSHCLDYGSSNLLFCYRKGKCDFDVRHNLSAAVSYDFPRVGHDGFLKALLNNWGLDGRFSVRTGFPVTLVGNSLLQNSGKIYDGGLSFVPGEPIYLYGDNCAKVLGPSPGGIGDLLEGQGCPGGRAINPNAFQPVDSGQGDTPRNFARGFGAWQMNMAVRREFPIYERLKLQFRAEAFNIFNHPNFGTVNGQCFGTAGTPGCANTLFGQATGSLASSLGTLSSTYQAGGPRSMQFALKLVF